MIYQGNKAKIRDKFIHFIQNCINENCVENYIEPFVGGANVIDHIQCKNRYGSDNNSELICLLTYIRDNPTIPIAPKECSFEHYNEVREDRKNKTRIYTQEYISLIGYFASFGGRYFDGGFGRDSKGGRSIYNERLLYAKNQAPLLKNIEFSVGDYSMWSNMKNCVFYLDPPYKDTKCYNGKDGFDYEKFYNWCIDLSENNWIFISEYFMPDNFKCIWQDERKVLQKSDRVIGDVYMENYSF